MKEVVLDRLSNQYLNKRVDKVISEILGIPRNQVQDYIEGGLVTVCGRRTAKSYRIKANDYLKVVIPPPKSIVVKPKDAPIKIVFEDEYIIVVDKPAGLVVHPGAALEEMSVVSALMYRGIALSSIGSPLRPGVVHRIDKDTSGIIVLAKTDRSHLMLAKQFFSHTIDRRYIGVVSGHLREVEGIIDRPINRHPVNRKVYVVSRGGREAITYFKLIKRLENYDVVMFKLRTGRTHQIRVHMKYLGCPLLGDATYGRVSNIIKRQALHAFMLGFLHPIKKESLCFFSRLPEDMKKIVIGG